MPRQTRRIQDPIGPATDRLHKANLAFAAAHPGESAARQPVHVVYGGAQLFSADTASKIGQVARRALEQHAGNPDGLADAVGWDARADLRERVYERVVAKLQHEAVADFRIDF